MKKKHYTEEQIPYTLRQAEVGTHGVVVTHRLLRQDLGLSS